MQCDDFPINEKVAVQLAGLQAQVSLGDPKDNRLDYYSDIDNYLPYRISRSRGDDIWVNENQHLPGVFKIIYFLFIFIRFYRFQLLLKLINNMELENLN